MKRILVVCYSQSGQLRNCIDSLTAPLKNMDTVSIDVLVPTPDPDYPFPWSFSAFIDVFPESVLQIPPDKIVNNYESIKNSHYDLIIIGYQVWYLNPSPPVMWFLKSELSALLNDTPVILVNACRNMWHNAWFKIKDHVTAAGGTIAGHIVLIDQGPAYATFLTTPLWLFSGRKKVIKSFPPAGVSTGDISSLQAVGNTIRSHMESDTLSSIKISKYTDSVPTVSKQYMLPERIGLILFWFWARVIFFAGKVSRRLRYPLELIFVASLVLTIILIVPIAVLANIPARTVFKSWTSNYLERLHNPFFCQKP